MLRETKSLPYISAASTLKNTYSNQYDAFSLNCPHVADSGSDDVKIEVTWTLNETVWLKIEDGEKKVSNRLTSINRRKVGGKTVLRIMLNNGRYMFDYDELTGDFSMEIRPVEIREDMGIWQCHVTVYQKGNTHILTSRSRVKSPNSIATDPPQMHSHSSEVLLKPPTSREIDYEMDLNPAAPYYDLDLPYYDPSSRSYARSAFFNNSPSKFLAKSYLVTFAVSLYCIMLL
ncbi:hypothetical protein WR25_11989 [Diploscapter pachys]|uniref:Uncharacterized protein n=1 Tax=Diploscapter pachys TaxID=2018661 RepID=A0A2A2K6F9_9BILA|nr:hypothetical protein WR25_11989 [Diploscapter pachys]